MRRRRILVAVTLLAGVLALATAPAAAAAASAVPAAGTATSVPAAATTPPGPVTSTPAPPAGADVPVLGGSPSASPTTSPSRPFGEVMGLAAVVLLLVLYTAGFGPLGGRIRSLSSRPPRSPATSADDV